MEKIILAPRQMHKNLLFSSRKEDLFVNPKILTKEEFLGKYYGRVTQEGAYYLFNNNDIIYDNLMQLIPYIPRANATCVREKNKKLFEYRNELEKEGFMEVDEFFEQFIKDKEIEIYGYSKNDTELISLLNIYSNKYEFKDFSKGNANYEIKSFPLLEDEIFYMLNSIAELLDNGVSPDDIFIYVSDKNAIYYMEKYFKSFGFEINFPNSTTLYSQDIVAKFLKNAKENKSFEVALDELENSDTSGYEDIVETIKETCAIDLEFDKKLDYVSSFFKARNIQNKRYENAVNVIDSPIFDENKYIFIPCFAQNIYPKSYKDNGYISDADKSELHVLTSLEKCRIEDEISRGFVLSNNKFFLSRSSASFADKYFASPFVKSLNFKENNIKDIPNKIYSKKYAQYRLGIDLDKRLYFRENSKYIKPLGKLVNINYRNYDNQYTNAEAIPADDFLSFSYTSIKTYYNCPFEYYLDYVLKITDYEDTFYTKFGNVAHYVFERQFDEDFDFEKVFEEGRAKEVWEPGEELFVTRLKEDIKLASDAAILHKNTYAVNAKVESEKKLSVMLTPRTKLEGRIDKIMLLDGSDAILVDYKTGSETFDRKKVEYGLSMQLPTYAYLFKNADEYKDFNVAGLYINNVINGGFSLEKKEDEIIDTHLKLNGVTVFDTESALKIDSSIANGKSFFIKGVATKNDELYKGRGKALIGKEELEDLVNLTHEKYLEADRRIRESDFRIAPCFIKNNDACKFCKHKDICFVKSSQKQDEEDTEDEEGQD